MQRTRRGPAWIAACLAALLVMAFAAPAAVAQDDPTEGPEPVDTDGDGQRDDWDGDGLPDDTDTSDCDSRGKMPWRSASPEGSPCTLEAISTANMTATGRAAAAT